MAVHGGVARQPPPRPCPPAPAAAAITASVQSCTLRTRQRMEEGDIIACHRRQHERLVFARLRHAAGANGWVGGWAGWAGAVLGRQAGGHSTLSTRLLQHTVAHTTAPLATVARHGSGYAPHPSKSKKSVCSRTAEPEGPARWVRLYLDSNSAKKLVSSIEYQVEPWGQAKQGVAAKGVRVPACATDALRCIAVRALATHATLAQWCYNRRSALQSQRTMTSRSVWFSIKSLWQISRASGSARRHWSSVTWPGAAGSLVRMYPRLSTAEGRASCPV